MAPTWAVPGLFFFGQNFTLAKNFFQAKSAGGTASPSENRKKKSHNVEKQGRSFSQSLSKLISSTGSKKFKSLTESKNAKEGTFWAFYHPQKNHNRKGDHLSEKKIS